MTTDNNSKTTSQRYKTELCRSYHETGLCKYGEKCQFAHGYNEIRSLNRHPKYKSVLCRTYHCTGYCKKKRKFSQIKSNSEFFFS
jgi:butyrate response factor 1